MASRPDATASTPYPSSPAPPQPRRHGFTHDLFVVDDEYFPFGIHGVISMDARMTISRLTQEKQTAVYLFFEHRPTSLTKFRALGVELRDRCRQRHWARPYDAMCQAKRMAQLVHGLTRQTGCRHGRIHRKTMERRVQPCARYDRRLSIQLCLTENKTQHWY